MKHYNDYREILLLMNGSWACNPALRALYCQWFKRIEAELPLVGPVVEIGSGCGNFKKFLPRAVATDAIGLNPIINCLVDARQMPFGSGTVGSFVLIDCLHHLPRPLTFLRSAAKCLQLGGRIVLLEPAATPWARLVWKLFHFESVDLSVNIFAEDATPEPPNVGFMFSNMGIATLLFRLNLAHTLHNLAGLSLRKLEYSDFLIYPATGGFSKPSLISETMLRALYNVEKFFTRPLSARLTGMRMLIVLERTETTE